jgi:dCMP deaminase
MRTDVPDWDTYFFEMAKHTATRSKDPSTQVGAIIIDKDKWILSTGYNGFAPGVHEDDKRWSRPEKYKRVIHAEMNSIAAAARAGHSTKGAHLYVTHYPCLMCARLIIASGIERVYTLPPPAGWEADAELAEQMFKEAKVEVFVNTGTMCDD